MAGVQHFICLITNHLDGENVKTSVISPAQNIFQAMAVARLTQDTSEVDNLKTVIAKARLSSEP